MMMVEGLSEWMIQKEEDLMASLYLARTITETTAVAVILPPKSRRRNNVLAA